MQRTYFRAFFPELLLNTLFSTILIAIIFQLLANAKLIKQDTAILEYAVSACEEAAILYNEEGGVLEQVAAHHRQGKGNDGTGGTALCQIFLHKIIPVCRKFCSIILAVFHKNSILRIYNSPVDTLIFFHTFTQDPVDIFPEPAMLES